MPVDRYIAALRSASPAPGPPEVEEACARAARAMGLVHTLMDFELLREDSPELRSPIQLRRTPSSARRFAGTEDAVFFYVGPPMLESERPGAFVFRAEVEEEEEGGVATPWDSGGLWRRRARHLNEEQRRALLLARTMSAPDYRRALGITLLIRFGGEAARYLRSELPQGADPDGVYDGDPASFTYEARIPSRLAIQTPELALVVVKRDYVDEGVHKLRSWCLKQKVPFEMIDEGSQSRTVCDAVLDFGLRNIS